MKLKHYFTIVAIDANGRIITFQMSGMSPTHAHGLAVKRKQVREVVAMFNGRHQNIMVRVAPTF